MPYRKKCFLSRSGFAGHQSIQLTLRPLLLEEVGLKITIPYRRPLRGHPRRKCPGNPIARKGVSAEGRQHLLLIYLASTCPSTSAKFRQLSVVAPWQLAIKNGSDEPVRVHDALFRRIVSAFPPKNFCNLGGQIRSGGAYESVSGATQSDDLLGSNPGVGRKRNASRSGHRRQP